MPKPALVIVLAVVVAASAPAEALEWNPSDPPGGSWFRDELALFADGFESAGTGAWTISVP